MLGVEPNLDCVTSRRRSGRHGFAGRDPQLLLDEIEAGDGLGDRMLDLKARVELDEPEPPVRDQELDRAGALVAERSTEGDRRLGECFPDLDVGRGSLLEHLLVAPLDRAVPVAEAAHLAVPVAEQLNLDVPGPLDELLAEDAVVAESRQRLSPRRLAAPRRGRRARARPACHGRRPPPRP